MPRLRIRHALVGILLSVSLLAQGTMALAGTTGAIAGTVVDTETNAPIPDAKVTVSSPSGTNSTQSNATGHYVFVSLNPDTYTVSVEKQGYEPATQAGITVLADQTQTVAVTLKKALQTIAKVTSRAAGSLIKPGTTADVYSVNAGTQSTVKALGGGGGLDNAYSAIATIPGAYVPVGQNGWFQNVYIRGGDYDQVGYEFDGVPVNRSFDNYPSTNASALGQQELQVYTGASPANSEGQGLAGFINQVIRSGTYPGFGSTDLGIGGPAYYHKFNLEAGGATPNRNFSWYVGIGGYNQDWRYYDNSNGAGVSALWGSPFDLLNANVAGVPAPGVGSPVAATGHFGVQCDPTVASASNFSTCYNARNGFGIPYGPGAYILGPLQALNNSASTSDRENVINLHFAIPHKNNPYRDDIQLLYDTSNLDTSYYNAPTDWGLPLYQFASTNGTLLNTGGNGLATPIYFGGFQYNGALGTTFTPGTAAGVLSQIAPYAYPSAANGLGLNGAIPLNLRDVSNNGQGIVKLQYQHNFDSSAYLRVYGYTFYSNWFPYGPQSTNENFLGINPSDYELDTHTSGVSATFAKQLSSEHLLQVQGSFTRASVIRDNNTQATATDTLLGGLPFAYMVNANNPTSGICYAGSGAVATPVNCNGTSPTSPNTVTLAPNAAVPGLAGSCGGGPCEYYVAENGLHATYNNVQPRFSAFSITDQWQPNSKLLVNLGLREDQFVFNPANTTGGTRPFWFNAWNNSMCVDTTQLGSKPVPKIDPTVGCTAANLGLTSNDTFAPATLSNVDQVFSFNELQPRLGLTYTVNSLNVVRASYGKYVQAPNSAFEQYNTLQQDLPDFIGPKFYSFGRTAPGFPIQPEVSYNADLSWEHQLKGTDVSFKLTPFYRKTSDQVQQFFLDPKTASVSN